MTIKHTHELMRWGSIGEGAEAEIDTGQDDEDRYGGERYSKGVRKRFIEGFL